MHPRLKRHLFLFLVTMAVMLAMSSLALADSGSDPDQHVYVGGLLGLSSMNNGGGTNFTFGGGAGYEITPQWLLAASLTYNNFAAVAPVSGTLLLATFAAKYAFIPEVSAGVKAGLGTIGYSGGGATASESCLTFGPTVAYDHMFNEDWSAGAEATYFWINNSNPQFSIFQILATAKYHFSL